MLLWLDSLRLIYAETDALFYVFCMNLIYASLLGNRLNYIRDSLTTANSFERVPANPLCWWNTRSMHLWNTVRLWAQQFYTCHTVMKMEAAIIEISKGNHQILKPPSYLPTANKTRGNYAVTFNHQPESPTQTRPAHTELLALRGECHGSSLWLCLTGKRHRKRQRRV